ncbi:hypothetical protein QAD02_000362 [Eretmocerus hayati]|uniref:Uncharacterized protein n=1 Tax=Eretmocerus hayati TaxID=131215 RepID=A0ACC2NDU2_9HYME|nr:hypothetical protein QAD02_000362 [Eretmocerus hayati]
MVIVKKLIIGEKDNAATVGQNIAQEIDNNEEDALKLSDIPTTVRESNATTTVQTGVKRPLSSSSSVSTVSSSDLHSKEEPTFTEVKEKVVKKSKNDVKNPIGYDEQLKPATEYFDKSEKKLPSSYEDFVKFVESTQKKSPREIAELARNYCDDFDALDDLLTNTYKYVSSRTIRSRLTRIKNSLSSSDNNTQEAYTDTESNAEEFAVDELADQNKFSLLINDGADQ